MKNTRLGSMPERMVPKRLGIFTTVWTVAVLYLATVIQSAVISYMTSGGPRVDILVTAAVLLSIYTNEFYGAVIGVTMGAVFDMFNFSRIPVMPVILLLVCAYCGYTFKNMKKGSLVMKGLAVTVANVLRFGLSFLFELGRNSTAVDQLQKSVLPGLAISLLISPVIMVICCPAARTSLFGRKKI